MERFLPGESEASLEEPMEARSMAEMAGVSNFGDSGDDRLKRSTTSGSSALVRFDDRNDFKSS